MPTIRPAVPGDEEGRARLGDDALERLARRRRRGARELRDEDGDRRDQVVVDRRRGLYGDHEPAEPAESDGSADPPRHIGWRTLS